jgi:AraC-like DNA-binding protein
VRSRERDRPSAQQRAIARRQRENTLRVGTTQAIPAVLRSLGFDPAEVLSEVGVDLKVYDDADNRMSFATRGRLLAHCVAVTGCRHFGFLVGQRAGLNSLGLVGLLVRSSPDVETALQSLERYFYLNLQGAAVALTVDANNATLRYDIYQARAEATDQVGAGALAVFCNILRDLCGLAWKPKEICFAQRRPEDVEPFRQFFRAPLRFDAEHHAVVFPAYWLQKKLPDTSPELRRLVQTQVDALIVRHGDDFPEQVRGVLRGALLTGHASADQVAAMFSMNRRTLTRRLSAFDTGFQKLVDEIRFEVARQMLEDSRIEILEISALLDYAGPNAFTRAFRRWTGTTPAKWRTKAKGNG